MTNETKNVPKLRFSGFNEQWILKKISDFSETSYGGGTPKTSKSEYWNGDIPWIQSSDLVSNKLYLSQSRKAITEDAINNSATKLIPPKSIAIVSRVGVGKLAFIDFKYCTSQDFISLSNLIYDNIFSVYVLYNKIKLISKNLQGTSIKGITKSELLNTIIFIPLKTNEQQKIGDFFSKLDRQIELEEQKLEKLEEQKKGYMQKIFSRELRFKDENGEDYPEWEETTIKEIASITTGNKDTKDAIENGKYEFYVRSPKIHKINSYSFDGEAVLTVGDGVGVGKVFHYVNGKFDYHQRVYKISDFNNYNALLFYYYFSTHFLREAQKYNAKTSVDSVRRDMIINMKIPNIIIEEQGKISNFLSKLDELINKHGQKIENLKIRKQGFLQKMFV